ncbi:unnamed protein product [Rotaria sordida]|uniref:Transposase n=1 Tax=Rotaria sordida TaxID=392033 RepID=A0A814QKA8_9BILA|nr:unnamed protein product [Rotaria sordida]CAF1120182.1 unnamed protein product [Rotaria sordida]
MMNILYCQDHNPVIETAARKVSGKKRWLIGKRANEIGPLAVYRELINDADRDLLAAGNYTQCPTIERIKKMATDFHDKSSEHIHGYIHDTGEMPFRAHLYSESQIRRYINYIRKEKYSYVHIDATGGILRKMSEQKHSFLYAIIFKDGIDVDDTVPLAHAILSSHTVASISYFFGRLGESIAEVHRKMVLPSFFIIDFSAAIMNAVLQTFNTETINIHLNRCWNVIQGQYNAKQLRSLSFIHLCCCHVIHAIARSLTTAHVDKKTRRATLHIFAFILCSNDIEQLYDILGSVINIFGDPNEQKAKEKLNKMLAFEFNVDEESESMLKDGKKIFQEAKEMDDELRVVDEYLRSNTPIIHQSPFNKEAIRRYPDLANIIHNKSKIDKPNNPLFSLSIIRIFYRWWAYLPLWTGLLMNFEERYSNDIKKNPSVIYFPIRYSNAVIESYFRTFKKSICKGKKNNLPSEIIMELHGIVEVQSKAYEFGIKQSSKARKRRKQPVTIEENWGQGTKIRTPYFDTIDKFASKRVRTKIDGAQSDNVIKKYSDSEETTTLASSDKSIAPSEETANDISSNESSRSSDSHSTSSSSRRNSTVSSEYSIDVPITLDKPTIDDDEQSEISVESNLDANLYSSITSTSYIAHQEPNVTTDQSSKKPPIQRSPQPETIVDGCKLRWPKFEMNNVLFEGQSYSLILTCPVDTALFALYFVYKTDINLADEFDNAPESSPYSTLVKTFQLVEEKGWDTARIYWLLTYNILNPSDQQPKSLFGSIDEQVFSFIKQRQRYSSTITCSRPDCKDKQRDYLMTELSLLPSDNCIEKFEAEDTGVCEAMMKELDEITETEALQKKYRNGRVPIINYETNRNEYLQGWLCDAVNVRGLATFDDGYPPIIITDIEPISKRSEEGYASFPVRLRDMKRVIRIGCVKYQLRAVIHNKDAHFTATLIGVNNNLYYFDDRQDVREVRTSTYPIVIDNINKTTENLKVILPPICFLILTILSILCHFLKKCYINDGHCKLAWFCLKRPAEYRRRREVARQREMPLDQLVVQSASTIYSIA